MVVVVAGESGVRIGDEWDDEDGAVAALARSRAGVEGVLRLAYDKGTAVEGVAGSDAADAAGGGGVTDAGMAAVGGGGGGVAAGTMGGGAAGG